MTSHGCHHRGVPFPPVGMEDFTTSIGQLSKAATLPGKEPGCFQFCLGSGDSETLELRAVTNCASAELLCESFWLPSFTAGPVGWSHRLGTSAVCPPVPSPEPRTPGTPSHQAFLWLTCSGGQTRCPCRVISCREPGQVLAFLSACAWYLSASSWLLLAWCRPALPDGRPNSGL